MGPRTGLDGCGKSRPTGIGSPELSTCSESLYRLSYRGPHDTERGEVTAVKPVAVPLFQPQMERAKDRPPDLCGERLLNNHLKNGTAEE